MDTDKRLAMVEEIGMALKKLEVGRLGLAGALVALGGDVYFDLRDADKCEVVAI